VVGTLRFAHPTHCQRTVIASEAKQSIVQRKRYGLLCRYRSSQ
jgi:hypothetical protein